MSVPDELRLPALVRVCPLCGGAGEREQLYNAGCGMGCFRSLGPCEMCTEPGQGWRGRGVGMVYRGTGRPVPESVVNQVLVMNGVSQ